MLWPHKCPFPLHCFNSDSLECFGKLVSKVTWASLYGKKIKLTKTKVVPKVPLSLSNQEQETTPCDLFGQSWPTNKAWVAKWEQTNKEPWNQSIV